MSNRTDFDAVARELADMFGIPPDLRDAPTGHLTAVERIETELHNAYVAGEEGGGCECSSCRRLGVAGFRVPDAADADRRSRASDVVGRLGVFLRARAQREQFPGLVGVARELDRAEQELTTAIERLTR